MKKEKYVKSFEYTPYFICIKDWTNIYPDNQKEKFIRLQAKQSGAELVGSGTDFQCRDYTVCFKQKTKAISKFIKLMRKNKLTCRIYKNIVRTNFKEIRI